MSTPRLSGPCTHVHHDYCLGPRMLLPCNCPCHATERADTKPTREASTIGFIVEPYE